MEFYCIRGSIRVAVNVPKVWVRFDSKLQNLTTPTRGEKNKILVEKNNYSIEMKARQRHQATRTEQSTDAEYSGYCVIRKGGGRGLKG